MPEATPPANTTGTETPPWFSTFDDASKGHIQAKGWDKLDAPAAALAALNAYKGVESKLGIPADRVLKLPEPTDAEGLKGVFQRLGVPVDAAGYDFSTVKRPDGSALDEGFAGFLREAALKHNVTKDGAAGLAAALIERDAKAAEAAATEKAVKVAADKAALDTEWAGKATVNKFLAERAAAMIGIDAATLNTAAELVGYSKVMKGFLEMAGKMGEAPLLGGNLPGTGNGALTVEQATARLADIKAGADKEFTARYHKGEQKAVEEMRMLTSIIVQARMSPRPPQ